MSEATEVRPRGLVGGLLAHRLIRMFAAGAASALVDLAVFNVLLWTVVDSARTWEILAANTAAFGCAMVANYTANARYTFRVRMSRRSIVAYTLFTGVGLIFYNVNLWWIRALLDADDAIMLNASKVIAMGLLVVWNYLGYQRVVFRTVQQAEARR